MEEVRPTLLNDGRLNMEAMELKITADHIPTKCGVAEADGAEAAANKPTFMAGEASRERAMSVACARLPKADFIGGRGTRSRAAEPSTLPEP